MDEERDKSGDIDAGRQADDRLIHALLRHTYDDQAAEQREQRVQRAMHAIREPAPRTTTGRLRFLTARRRSAWAVAALVLLAVGLWILTFSSTPAMASVAEIVSSLAGPGDRTYRIRMEDRPAPSDRRPPEEEWPEDMPRPGLDGAKLHLRDGRKYLLVRPDPNGEWIYDGYDGRRSWRVKDGAVAETKEGLGAGGIPMPPMMADVPFCDLHGTLERILADYTVEHLGQASIRADGAPLTYVKVRRQSRDVKGPETIEIWADPESALPVRIVFDDAKLHGNRHPVRLTFDLVDEGPFRPGWFTPAPHLSQEK